MDIDCDINTMSFNLEGEDKGENIELSDIYMQAMASSIQREIDHQQREKEKLEREKEKGLEKTGR